MNTATSRLDAAIRVVCPLDGVSVRTPGDPATVRIDFAKEATSEQRKAAQVVVDSFDWSDASQAQWEAVQNISAAGALLQSADPIPQAVRVTLKAIQDLNNIRWRLVQEGRYEEVTPVLQAEVDATVLQYLQEGYSLPD